MDTKPRQAKEPKLDYSITKVCQACGKEYHPRDNGYQYTSKFCGQGCMKKARRSETQKALKAPKQP